MGNFVRRALALVAFTASLTVHMPAQAEKPMEFYVDTSKDVRLYAELMQGGVQDVYASGEITDGTTARFDAFIKKHKIKAAKIHFDSPGGSLFEGIDLGRKIRDLKFFTTVGVHHNETEANKNLTSICASACAYAFAGGAFRFLTQYTGRLGVHQFYSDDKKNESSERAQKISAIIVGYLAEMGVDARAFVVSTLADRNDVVWLDPDTALRLRFANNGTNPPEAEIRLSGMQPYLRIEQEHHTGTTRVLIACEENNEIRIAYGNVTNPTNSAQIFDNAKRSYFEVDGYELLPADGSSGLRIDESTVWIMRTLAPAKLVQFISSTTVFGWVDGYGAVRFGTRLDMPTIKEKIHNFALQCIKRR